MQRRWSLIAPTRPLVHAIAACLVTALTGCGGAETGDTESRAEDNEPQVIVGKTPEETVGEFMTAFKDGDDAKANQLLTDKARKEVERTNYAVSPPGSKGMQYKVGEVEYVAEDKSLAHVACHIIDPEDAAGNLDVVWFLRKEAVGWRVAGVAMKVFPDELPVLYNFEDMEDLERKVELVKQEMVRRATQTVTQGATEQPAAHGPDASGAPSGVARVPSSTGAGRQQ
jgi:hypothetical protein